MVSGSEIEGGGGGMRACRIAAAHLLATIRRGSKEGGMSSRRARQRGRTHAVVGTERAVAHLDSTSETHARDRELAKRAEKTVAGVIIADDSPPDTLKFPSLEGGVLLGGDGREIGSEEHEALLNRLRLERASYVVTQSRSDGREYKRRRKTNGLRQLAISFRPEHALAFARLERVGLGVRREVIDEARRLGAEFERLSGYRLEATEIHPEEGSLHLHLVYATVGPDQKLLHPVGGAGRKGLRLAGPSVIGTLRLVDAGIWPENDGRLAQKWLADRRRGGVEPVDFSLSQYLDGLAEKALLALGSCEPVAKAIIEEARTDYERAAKVKRESRPDVLEMRVGELEGRNLQLVAEVEQLRSELARANETRGQRFPVRLRGPDRSGPAMGL